MPSNIACIYQLAYGTRERRFPNWFNPVELILIGKQNVTRIVIKTALMNGKGELATLRGALAQLCMSIQALTSIPAIGNLLNWREWHFVQSKLGTVTLLLAIGHVVDMAAPRWIEVTLSRSFSHVSTLCLYLPVVTISLKAIFWLPCFSRPIHRIRRGETNKRKTVQNLDKHP